MTDNKSIFVDPENMETEESKYVENHLDQWMDIIPGILINPTQNEAGEFGLCIEKKIRYKTQTAEGEKTLYIPFKVEFGVIEGRTRKPIPETGKMYSHACKVERQQSTTD